MHYTNRPSLWTRISALIPYVLLTIMLASSMIPLVSMLGTSFRTKETLMTTSSIIPPVPSLHFYRNVLSNPRIAGYFKNSFVISSITCLITATISIFGGYAMARFRNRVKGVGFFTLFVILVQMFPTIQMVIPLYTTFNSLGILNKSYTLLFAYPAFMLPMNLMMMQSFIEGVPYEMEEAGRIDGCSRIQVIIKLVLPIAKPGVASAMILAFNSCWNEFLIAMLLIKNDKFRTMPIGLNNYMQENVTDWGSIMAASTLMIIPVMLFLNVLQKNIVGGLTMGAVKG